MKAQLDYHLNRLFYDLHMNRELAAEYRADRNAVLPRYPLTDEVRRAVESDDVPALARLTNPFLLRYYYVALRWTDQAFLERITPLRAEFLRRQISDG